MKKRAETRAAWRCKQIIRKAASASSAYPFRHPNRSETLK
jgi:hypothetical protein